MSQLSKTIANAFTASFCDLTKQVHALAAGLTEDQFWTKPYSYGNSFGHLVLHLTGNLNYFIGSQIAHTGYVRVREQEFNDPGRPSKEQTLKALDEAVALVTSALEKQSDENWSQHYEAEHAADFIRDRFGIFLRCATHFHHHLGQMIYLQKALKTGELERTDATLPSYH